MTTLFHAVQLYFTRLKKKAQQILNTEGNVTIFHALQTGSFDGMLDPSKFKLGNIKSFLLNPSKTQTLHPQPTGDCS